MRTFSRILDHLGHHDSAADLPNDIGNNVSSDVPGSDSVHDASRKLQSHGAAVEPSRVDKLKGKAKKLQHAIEHPRQATKQRPQKNESKLRALRSTALDLHPRDLDLKLRVQHAERVVLDLEERREGIGLSWHLSRYVHRARVVRRFVKFPDRSDPQHFGDGGTGKEQRFLWVKWLGHKPFCPRDVRLERLQLALYGFQDAGVAYIEPTNTKSYNRQELIRAIERLLVASQSLQYWWNRIRYVYRWENPWLTSTWLILYLLLLKTGYFMTFYYSYLLWSNLSNWDGKHTRNWMKQSTERSTQTHGRAVMLSELVLRHGPDAWFEPFMEEMGPWRQEQILDLAQFLEISNNYYMSRNRRSGMYTSVTYFALILICGLPSLEFSIKVFWLSCGFVLLQGEANLELVPKAPSRGGPCEAVVLEPSNTVRTFLCLVTGPISGLVAQVDCSNGTYTTGMGDEDDDGDDDESMSFDCLANIDQHQLSSPNDEVATSWQAHCKEHRGRLELVNDMQALRFASRGGIGVNTIWTHPISHLLELQKLTLPLTGLPAKPSVTKLSKSSAALRIIWAGPSRRQEPGEDDDAASGLVEEVLYAMNSEDRDDVFNTVIGISSFAWQELQPEIRSGENRTFFR
ncbi:hypothetical protein AC579_7409 [Pseudocercospora musae]|uniref:Uncharacterized protein n=1 Tax=Pseudocercospora musae TaxID=113226 RepID=A0A139IQE9_9PEZI|nr:hypothetical protein AC579_7409 [Pseudocercospora musae]